MAASDSFMGRTIWFTIFFVTLGLTMSGPLMAGPESASPWLKKFHSEARLVAGRDGRPENAARLLAGIHLRLDWGWKTYWRSPGDSGIPPYFDWSGSRNLKSAKVLWPAPRRFADPAGSSVGYKHEVVLPVVLEPEREGEPIDVSLRFEYAVCKEICAPAEAKMVLAVVPASLDASPFTTLIARYLGRVPRRGGGQSLPRIHAVDVDLSSAAPHIDVTAEFAPKSGEADLFVEGPEELYFPLPDRVETTPGGRVRFRVDLAGSGDMKALKGQTLTLTLVSDSGQSEALWPVE